MTKSKGATIVLALLGIAGAAVGAAVAAGFWFSAPKYKGPQSDHFDGERFLNIKPTKHAGPKEMVKWLTNRDEGHWDAWLVPSVRFEVLVPGGAWAE